MCFGFLNLNKKFFLCRIRDVVSKTPLNFAPILPGLSSELSLFPYTFGLGSCSQRTSPYFLFFFGGGEGAICGELHLQKAVISKFSGLSPNRNQLSVIFYASLPHFAFVIG